MDTNFIHENLLLHTGLTLSLIIQSYLHQHMLNAFSVTAENVSLRLHLYSTGYGQ